MQDPDGTGRDGPSRYAIRSKPRASQKEGQKDRFELSQRMNNDRPVGTFEEFMQMI